MFEKSGVFLPPCLTNGMKKGGRYYDKKRKKTAQHNLS